MSKLSNPSCFIPTSMETKHYDGVTLLYNRSEKPVAVLRSKNPATYCWCVLFCFSCIYFKSRKDAYDYCYNRKFKQRGGMNYV